VCVRTYVLDRILAHTLAIGHLLASVGFGTNCMFLHSSEFLGEQQKMWEK